MADGTRGRDFTINCATVLATVDLKHCHPDEVKVVTDTCIACASVCVCLYFLLIRVVVFLSKEKMLAAIFRGS